MPLESTTTRLQSITSVSGTSKTGDSWVRYDFLLDGFKKKFSTFNKDLVDMSMQGKMVKADYSVEPASFTDENNKTINYERYNLENITVLEGDTGTLDDVIAPIARQESGQRLQEAYTNGEPRTIGEYLKPKHPAEQAAIARQVALKAAIEFNRVRFEAGLDEKLDESKVLEYTNNFQSILESR